MNIRLSLTAQAHKIIENHLTVGDIAIDATVGNGHDTLFLAKKVGKDGKIFGFDIQQQAIDETHLKLESAGLMENIRLFLCSHGEMNIYIPEKYHKKINVITFNLGYLPGSDKLITTQKESTLFALNIAVELLAPGGIISVIAYPGHPTGAIENKQLVQWSNQLNRKQFNRKIIDSSDKANAPRLFIIQQLC